MRTFAFLVFFPTAILTASLAQAAEPFNSLAQACRTNWGQYSSQLNSLQQNVTIDVRKMSREQVENQIDSNNELMLFVKMTWPEILEGKDDFWKAGKECADLHRAFRSKMDAHTATREDLQDLKDCIGDKLSRRMLPPFDKILGCYDSLVR